MRLLLPVLLALCVGSSAARAQSALATAGAAPLPLAGALREARERHPALAAARLDEAALRERPRAERALRPPMVDARIWQWPVTTLNPGNVDMYMFMLQQELPGKGKRDLRAEAASREADVAAAGADAVGWQVATAVKQAYAALRAVREEIAATEATEPLLVDLIEASELSYAAGRGTQASVLRASVARSRLVERLARLRGEESLAASALNVAIGRAPGHPIGPLDPATPLPPPPPLDVLVAQAAERHPDMATRRAAVRASGAAAAVARAERRPDWVVEGGYMLMPGEAGAWSARVGVTLPMVPWARARVTAAVAEAEARERAARARVEARAIEISGSLAEAHAAIGTFHARLAVLRERLLPQAEHLGEATRLAYAAGQAPLTDVLEAVEETLQVDVEIAQLTGALHRAWADLEGALGRPIVTKE